MSVEIIGRTAWGARAPKSRRAIQTPTPELWLHHTAGSESGAAGVRRIQNFHMDSRGWWDIAYSFLIDRVTLDIYEGRGAGVSGGHTANHNSVSHAICVMGNFENNLVPDELRDRIAELVAHGHAKGWWPNQLTGGHRDVAATACPGRNLYAAIRDINAHALGAQPPERPPTVEPSPHIRRVQRALMAMGQTLPQFGADGLAGEETAAAAEAASTEYAKLAAHVADDNDAARRYGMIRSALELD